MHWTGQDLARPTLWAKTIKRGKVQTKLYSVSKSFSADPELPWHQCDLMCSTILLSAITLSSTCIKKSRCISASIHSFSIPVGDPNPRAVAKYWAMKHLLRWNYVNWPKKLNDNYITLTAIIGYLVGITLSLAQSVCTAFFSSLPVTPPENNNIHKHTDFELKSVAGLLEKTCPI